MTLLLETPVAAGARARCVSRQPLYFEGQFGTLHLPPDGAVVRAGVVLCPPLGREARIAHRPLWLFANQLADRGFAVLRYDHIDTGDSVRLPADSDAWTAWIEGARAAGDLLKARTGGAAIVFAGLRIGATLAALAAEGAHARGLMLLAPVHKGAMWIRELQLSARIMDPAGQAAQAAQDAPIDADGIRTSAATIASAGKVDLARLVDAPASVFLASRAPMKALTAGLESLGSQVETCGFEGYDELFRESFLNSPPQALFDQAAAWLDNAAESWPSGTASTASPSAAVLDLGNARESAVSFGAGLQGVLCAPAQAEPQRRAVIFTNTGGDPRAGIGGFAVDCARRLAACGVASLRFDFSGLGDSAFEGGWRSNIYEVPRVAEFEAAVSFLQAAGYSEVVAVGVCSGAYHAHRAAFQDRRVGGVFSINPGDWVWAPGRQLVEADHVSGASTRVLMSNAVGSALSAGKWRKVLRGELKVGEKLRAIGGKLLGKLRMKLASREDTRALRREMKQLSDRGARCTVVLGLQDAALDDIEIHFGRRGGWLAGLPGMQVQLLPNLDHGLFFAESRAVAEAELLAFLGLAPRGA